MFLSRNWLTCTGYALWHSCYWHLAVKKSWRWQTAWALQKISTSFECKFACTLLAAYTHRQLQGPLLEWQVFSLAAAQQPVQAEDSSPCISGTERYHNLYFPKTKARTSKLSGGEGEVCLCLGMPTKQYSSASQCLIFYQNYSILWATCSRL